MGEYMTYRIYLASVLLATIICGFCVGGADLDTTTFVTSHRVSMNSPGPANKLTEGAGFDVAFKVSFERWPVNVLRHEKKGCESVVLEIILDGAPVGLELPCPSSTRVHTKERDDSERSNPWQGHVTAFCEAKGLSGDNCGWLWLRAQDLWQQLIFDQLGFSDAELLTSVSFCLTLKRKIPPGAHQPLNLLVGGGGGGHVACGSAGGAAAADSSASATSASEVRLGVPGLSPGTYTLSLSMFRAGAAGGAAPALPGYEEVDVRPVLEVESSQCSSSSSKSSKSLTPTISHPRHGALVGSNVVLRISDQPSVSSLQEDTDSQTTLPPPPPRPRALCLSLDGAQLGCRPLTTHTQKQLLRDLAPGRHKLEAWWGDDGSGRDERWTASFSSACRSKSEFQVTNIGPAAKRETAWGIGEEARGLSDSCEHSGVGARGDSGGDRCTQGSSSSSSSSSPLPPKEEEEGDDEALSEANVMALASGLVLVTGASERYFEQRILHNLVGSVHFWEPQATVQVWDFGLSPESKATIKTWRNVILCSLPRPHQTPLNPLPLQTAAAAAAAPDPTPAHSIGGGEGFNDSDDGDGNNHDDDTVVPAHFHVPGFGAYAAKPWVTNQALMHNNKKKGQRRLDPQRHEARAASSTWSSSHPDSRLSLSSSPSANKKKNSVLWIDANCELRRPLFGTTLPEDLLTNGAFFVTHPYGFPSPQFHHPDAVHRLGCGSNNSALHTTPSAETGTDGGLEGVGAVVVVEGSLPHCATTFMGFTQVTQAGRAAAERVLAPLVACGERAQCVNPEGSSRANHRQEQTALNAILCANSLAGDNRRLQRSKAGGSKGAGEGAGWEDSTTSTVGTAVVGGEWARRLCTADPRFRLTADFENRNHPLQPAADPEDWNEMALYTRRGHHHKPYVPYLRVAGN